MPFTMHETAKPSERRKYRRYDMPSEKRDAYLLWNDQALRVECVDFSAGGCGVIIEEKVEFEIGQIVILKNDQGKFRVSIANISYELGRTRLGCEYIESVISEFDVIQNRKPVKQRKFKSASLTDLTMLMGLLVFGMLACIIYTVVSNHESGEDDNNRSGNRIVTTRNRPSGPKDFSTDAKRAAKDQAFSRTITNMKKRVEMFKKVQQRYIERIQERIAKIGTLMKSMGIDTEAIFESLRNVSIPDENSENGSNEDSANTENVTTDN